MIHFENHPQGFVVINVANGYPAPGKMLAGRVFGTLRAEEVP